MSECSEEFYVDFNEASTTTTTTDDGIFLGTDAISDFLSAGGTFSDIFDDMPGKFKKYIKIKFFNFLIFKIWA